MLLASIEKILNRSLPRSPRAQALAAALAGRSMAVEMTGAGPVVVSSTGEHIRIERGTGDRGGRERQCAAPSACWPWRAGSPRACAATGATISGDSEVAQKFSELLGLLRPDPEEELAQLVGDAPAHHLGRLARAAAGFARARRTAPASPTSPSTSPMNAATWCRRPKAASCWTGSTRCAMTWIASRRAWSTSRNDCERTTP